MQRCIASSRLPLIHRRFDMLCVSLTAVRRVANPSRATAGGVLPCPAAFCRRRLKRASKRIFQSGGAYFAFLSAISYLVHDLQKPIPTSVVRRDLHETDRARPIEREFSCIRFCDEFTRTFNAPPGIGGVFHFQKEVCQMLYWALLFFIVALVALVFGFGGIAAGAAGIAKILFFVFLVLFILSLLTGMRRPPA